MLTRERSTSVAGSFVDVEEVLQAATTLAHITTAASCLMPDTLPLAQPWFPIPEP